MKKIYGKKQMKNKRLVLSLFIILYFFYKIFYHNVKIFEYKILVVFSTSMTVKCDISVLFIYVILKKFINNITERIY